MCLHQSLGCLGDRGSLHVIVPQPKGVREDIGDAQHTSVV